MSVYRYSGVTDQGKDVQGIVDAETLKSARGKLRQDGIFPVKLSEETNRSPSSAKKEHSHFISLRPDHSSALPAFTKQCSILLEAKIPLLRTLSILIEQLEDREFRAVLSEVRESIKNGKSFGDALSAYPRVFSSMYVHMVKAAEIGGVLSEGLGRLANYLERQAQLKGRLINALMYPAILASVGMLILVGLVTFVIPQITAVFSDMQEALPLPTVMLLGMSSLMNTYGWAVGLFLLIGLVSGYWLLSTSSGRYWWDRRVLRFPILGKILLFAALARFAETLGTLLLSSVPLLEGLHIAKKVINNQFLETIIDQTANQVREGQNFANPLSRTQIIPPLFVNMVSVGEQTGDLQNMLLKIGQAYDVEVEMSLAKWISFLEPILVLVMGFIVLFIVLAVLLPLFQMSQIIQ